MTTRNLYISSSAQSGGTGTIDSPFNTFASLNWTTIASFVAANDDVFINLKCGDTFLEQLTIGTSGTASHYITIQKYGTGSLPIINAENIRSYSIYTNAKNYIKINSIICNNGNMYNIRIHGSSNVTIEDCISSIGKYGIYISGTGSNFSLNNYTVSGMTNNTIHILETISNCTINGLYAHDCSLIAVYNKGVNTVITNFIISSMGEMGIYNYLNTTGSITITDGNINNTQDGILTTNNTNTTVLLEDITISNCLRHGIYGYTNTTTQFTIKDTISSNNAGYGIYLEATNINITNNTIRYNSSDGIRVTGTTTTGNIKNNIVEYNGVDGISLSAGAHNIVIENNIASYNGQTDTVGNGDGITCHAGNTGIVIVGNYCHHNRNSGLAMVETASGIIYNNTIILNGDSTSVNMGVRGGYYCSPSATTTWILKNNIFCDNYPAEITCSTTGFTSSTLDNNCYYHAANNNCIQINSIMQSFSTYHNTYEPNSFYNNPLITSDGSLSMLSSCIDAGITITDVNDAGQLDMFGYAVFGKPNIGCSQQYGRQAKGTLTLSWTPGFNKADVSGELNILSFDSSTNHLRYDATNGAIELYDGTNIASVALDCVADTNYAIKATWEGSSMKLWVNATAGTIGTFAGSFATGSMVIGLSNNELQYVKDPKVLKQPNWDTPS